MYRTYPPNLDLYEHGISINEGRSTLAPGLKLIATTKLPIYSSFNLTIVDDEGRSLNESAVRLVEIDHAHFHADYYDEYDLRYCVLSALYHVARLIDLYVWNVEHFEKNFPQETTVRGNIHGPNVYYEIDAFLSSGRRIYETISNVLWKHYHRGEPGRWSGMNKAIKSLDKVPLQFASELRESWNRYGSKLKDYRDCVMHHVPLHETSETCWLNRHGKNWGMTVKLPANPQAKSRKQLDYNSGPDALTYCHEVAVHLVKLCTSLNSQEQIVRHFRGDSVK